MNGTPCNCMKLRRASLAITRMYDHFLSPVELTINQFSILMNTHYHAPISVSDLASQVGLDRTTMVRNLKSIEKQGLIIDIARSGTRNRQLILTKKGQEKLASALPIWTQAQDKIQMTLGESDLENLSSLLLKVECICKF